MFAARLTLAVLLAALLAAAAAAPDAPARLRRQLADDNTLQPLDDASNDDQAREKRKLEGITEAKFGIKNAVLGFVFGKINSLIDSKTRFVESLDRKNIELNKQYGIEAPKGGGLSSLSGIVGQVIGPKLQLLGPKIQAVSGLLGGASGGSGGSEWRYVEAPASHKSLEANGAAVHNELGAHFGEYYTTASTPRYPGQLELVEYTPQRQVEYGARTGGYHADGTTDGSADQAHRRHPRLRPQQGQPGLSREPVWTIRVAPHPYD